MSPSRHKLLLSTLCGVILLNFIAQVPYAIHQYGTVLTGARALLLMLAAFPPFALGYALYVRGRRAGRWLLLGFAAVEFAFYALTLVLEVASGNGLFFHLFRGDWLLRAVFAIGYLNLPAAGMLLWLMAAQNRRPIRNQRA